MNLTCAATRRPIQFKDPIRVIFLAANPSFARHPGARLHMTDAWVPISLPIAMEYDDFGRSTPVLENDWRLELMLKKLDLDLETLFKQIKKGELFAPTRKSMRSGLQPTPSVIGMMAIHEAAYQVLCQSLDRLGETVTLADLIKEEEAAVQQIIAMKHPVMSDIPDGFEMTYWIGNLSDSSSVGVFNLDGPSPRDVFHLFRDFAQQGDAADSERMQDALKSTCEMMIMHQNMASLAIGYGPNMYASNDFDTKLLDRLHQIAMAA